MQKRGDSCLQQPTELLATTCCIAAGQLLTVVPAKHTADCTKYHRVAAAATQLLALSQIALCFSRQVEGPATAGPATRPRPIRARSTITHNTRQQTVKPHPLTPVKPSSCVLLPPLLLQQVAAALPAQLGTRQHHAHTHKHPHTPHNNSRKPGSLVDLLHAAALICALLKRG